MSDEVKNLIESVEVHKLFGLDPVVKKSDFYRVVEELTKWHSGEDGLPHEVIVYRPFKLHRSLIANFLYCVLSAAFY